MDYKLTVLDCKGNQLGHTKRPYAINDEIVYEMSLQLMMEDEAFGRTTQIDHLIQAIEEKTNIKLSHEELLEHIREVQANGYSYISNKN